MSVLDLFRTRASAPVARERLQILLSYERGSGGQSDLLSILREDILAAISKHIIVERDNIQVRMERGDQVSSLEINVEIPHPKKLPTAAGF
jgi:cell division topological specificity factor